jgi:hypothetical protein
MPAILPARLRQQAALLVKHFYKPAAFVRSLHHLLDGYADRVHRPGQAGEPPPLLTAYKVRPPVLRQILLELAPLARDDPESGLTLCDALWEQPYLEFRLLAASLLGQIPCIPSEPILERLHAWIKPEVEARLVDALFTHGLACLRQKDPMALIGLAESWLNEKDWFYQQMGLRLLLPLINDPQFENLPVFYRLILPLTRTAPVRLRPDLLDVLAALTRRSPNETAYFLQRTAAMPNSPDTAWLIRQSLHEFPEKMREGLRDLSRERNEPTHRKRS